MKIYYHLHIRKHTSKKDSNNYGKNLRVGVNNYLISIAQQWLPDVSQRAVPILLIEVEGGLVEP